MLSAVFGLFSQDLAVDLGTTSTRIYLRGSGVVCDEPTVVAVHTDPRGRRKVLAVGSAARPMLGRTPVDVETVQPVRDGAIRDYEVAEALLLHLVRKIHGRNRWMSPRMVVALPHGATDMERRAIRESCEQAGAREVHLVPRPLAAGLGAGLPVGDPGGHLVVDLGGGSTEIAVLSMGSVVSCVAVQGGGEAMDHAIVEYFREKHSLLVGMPTAERLKHELGTAVDEAVRYATVAGRCLTRGIPRQVEVSSADVREALRPRIDEIARAIAHTLDRCPPELAADIVDSGVVLCGGGGRLRALDVALRDATGLAVIVAETPDRAVVQGAGQALDQSSALEAMAV